MKSDKYPSSDWPPNIPINFEFLKENESNPKNRRLFKESPEKDSIDQDDVFKLKEYISEDEPKV
jgi:hypothetical protein